jgi:hypothetical protein
VGVVACGGEELGILAQDRRAVPCHDPGDDQRIGAHRAVVVGFGGGRRDQGVVGRRAADAQGLPIALRGAKHHAERS